MRTGLGNDCLIRVFVKVCILFEYLNGALHVNVWASIIQTFQSIIIPRAQVISDKQSSTVLHYYCLYSHLSSQINVLREQALSCIF